MSSSVTFLFMTSRRRWVPASGAKVSPVFLDAPTAAAMSTPKESSRWEGMLTFMPLAESSSFRPLSISAHCEWSVVERDESEHSS